MPIILKTFMQSDIIQWRRHLHQNPELLYDVNETAGFIAEKLSAFGCDTVETGIGKSGVVGLIGGKLGGGPVIGLRADMDALPILESSGKAWTSKIAGRAHSCGHDGHMAMLLGAARYLSETRNFKGTVAVIFQPAEEGGAGALAMINDGLMDRFKIAQVYGMHNEPHIPIGQFAIRKGAILASADTFEITVKGRGSHAGQPHLSVDPVVAASHIVIALQSVVSRETDPLQAVVITVASIHGGDTHNVIPSTVRLAGTIRTLRPELRDFAERRLGDLVGSIAVAHGASADVSHSRGYPVTFNHDAQTDLAASVARSIVGAAAVNSDLEPRMAAEDFAFMLEARPGSIIIIGNGETAGLHNPAYDFNDDAIPYGIAYWVNLAETALAA
ncbi:M20 aminoacylase family protein [Rhizobium laguerreae]|uniref:Hippurate hydrolase n=1 Tax=Rhizobium laguerreae TaxID=1076926 RepID=A0AAX2QG18_9HYPH|nr:M20 aminoacylase family protein [Rhizobium laguerreae]MBY3088346.1 amidohydrolase [Rhizobium laguerreae]MBY3530193.1 amidohydrolase [Rhizobium laguerreae]NKM22473.1 amidohydrolase [Rhizobium laguerreae]NKM32053.1 amidohydrolase [Rhizobium laguerreae]TCU19480.1 hippurate hydrolase [Rhizobium laguerreae]